jgi:hypothetical protein
MNWTVEVCQTTIDLNLSVIPFFLTNPYLTAHCSSPGYRPWFYNQTGATIEVLKQKSVLFGPNLVAQDGTVGTCDFVIHIYLYIF